MQPCTTPPFRLPGGTEHRRSLLVHLCVALLHLLLPQSALAHGILMSPNPRYGTSNAGANKGASNGPCGSGATAAPQAAVANFTAGQRVRVRWRVDAAHGGSCRIALAPLGTASEPLEAGFARQPLTDTFRCAATAGYESREVTVPRSAPPGSYVLRWHWVGDSDYWDCADVRVVAPQPAAAPLPRFLGFGAAPLEVHPGVLVCAGAGALALLGAWVACRRRGGARAKLADAYGEGGGGGAVRPSSQAASGEDAGGTPQGPVVVGKQRIRV